MQQSVLLLRLFLHSKQLEQKIFTSESVLLGRDPYSDLYIEDPEVSRLHASIDRAGARYFLRDRDSYNGTHVNGVRIERATPLETGDCIRLGRFSVEVEIHDAVETSTHGTPSPDSLELGDHTMRPGNSSTRPN